MPSLAALRAFAAVARTGSFGQAAQALHVSTSAVSHQVRGLEAQLGTVLLTRARNGAGHSRTAPTEAGARLLAAIEDSLAQLADACDAVRSSGSARLPDPVVSANGPVAALWLAPRLARYATARPEIAWQMRAVEDEAPDLVAQGIDLAIVRCQPGTTRPADRLLFAETVVPVASPAIGPLDGPADLLRHTLLEEAHGADIEKNWPHWLALLGCPSDAARIARFSSFAQVISAAVAGAGIALGRLPLVEPELAAGRLVRLFPEHALPGSRIFVLRTRPGRPRHPGVATLADFLLGAEPVQPLR